MGGGDEEAYKKVGESKAGIDCRTVSEIMCFLKAGYVYFKGVLTYMHNGQAVFMAKINL